MPRKRPSIHVHYSQRSMGVGPGVYAYYDSGRNQIHILDRDTLYTTVLAHELKHSESRLTRFLDSFRILQRPILLTGLIGVMLGLLTIVSTLLSANIFIAAGVLLGIFLMILLGYFDYYFEEWRAEHAAYDATDNVSVPTATLP